MNREAGECRGELSPRSGEREHSGLAAGSARAKQAKKTAQTLKTDGTDESLQPDRTFGAERTGRTCGTGEAPKTDRTDRSDRTNRARLETRQDCSDNVIDQRHADRVHRIERRCGGRTRDLAGIGFGFGSALANCGQDAEVKRRLCERVRQERPDASRLASAGVSVRQVHDDVAESRQDATRLRLAELTGAEKAVPDAKGTAGDVAHISDRSRICAPGGAALRAEAWR